MKKGPLGGDRGKARPPAKGAGEGNLENRQGIQGKRETGEINHPMAERIQGKREKGASKTKGEKDF